jgi:acid phosphatase (class A)
MWDVDFRREQEITDTIPHTPLTFSTTQTWDPKMFLLTIEERMFTRDALMNITLPPPPSNDSEATQFELTQLHQYAESRTAAQLDEILSEMDIQSTRFGNLLYSELTNPITHKATATFIKTANKELSPILFRFKKEFDRVRPTHLDPTLTAAIDVPNHPAYPSGHATQAHLIALLLSQLDPPHKDAYIESAYRIAKNREIAGLHYPSDSEAGRILAEQFMDFIQETPWYKAARMEAQKEW